MQKVHVNSSLEQQKNFLKEEITLDGCIKKKKLNEEGGFLNEKGEVRVGEFERKLEKYKETNTEKRDRTEPENRNQGAV